MGGAAGAFFTPHLNASYKNLFGWLTPQSVTSTGLYNIIPYETSGNTVKSLQIAPAGASDTFYLEFRQPLGFDATSLAPQVFDGTLVHLGGNPAFVLNMHPKDTLPYGAPTPALLAGEKYIDYANRFSVTTVSASPAAVQVRILLPGVASPTLLFVAPAYSAIVSGVTTVSVDALDRGSIAKVELSVDGTLIGTQTQTLNQPDTAGPAQYYPFSWDTTGVTSGSHTLTAAVFNALNVSATTNITVTVRKPPVVAISSPSDQTSLTDVSSITLVAGVMTDNASVQSVQFFANGNSLGFGSANASGGYSFTWSNVPAGTYAITATATDANGLVSTSAPITITVHNPVVSTGGVVNGASLANGVAVTPGSLVSIFGSDLAPSGVGAGSIPLPDEISGVSVTMNGVPAPLAYASSKQINAQVPWELWNATGAVPVVVTRNGVPSPPESVQVSAFSPAIFTLESGVGQAVAINADGSLAEPENSIPGSAAHPAKPGDTITIYATGLGAVTPPAQDGHNSSDELRKTVTTPTVLVGGAPCTVLFSGLSPQFVGVNQLNVTITPGAPAGDAVPLQIQIGGVTSGDKVTIAVGGQ